MARRIKRYENRKLYDTETSEYVSLSDIADLVRSGETVEVISSDLLHALLRRSEEVLDSGLDQLRTAVDDLVQSSFGQLKHLVQSPRQEELNELRQQLRRLEHRLSILLDDFEEQHPDSRETGPNARSDPNRFSSSE
ncbi:MAG: hypothetical protein BRD39_01165 [Bacteroidetes bacterium QH_9_64_21]|nr:MAG: hypothetical protein BRD39_01165 [Bacteroidetes bacterium QH_9_64_21]